MVSAAALELLKRKDADRSLTFQSYLPQDAKTDIQELWERLDVQQNGHITAKRLHTAINAAAGKAISGEAVRALLQRLDSTGHLGRIAHADFTEYFAAKLLCPESYQEALNGEQGLLLQEVGFTLYELLRRYKRMQMLLDATSGPEGLKRLLALTNVPTPTRSKRKANVGIGLLYGSGGLGRSSGSRTTSRGSGTNSPARSLSSRRPQRSTSTSPAGSGSRSVRSRSRPHSPLEDMRLGSLLRANSVGGSSAGATTPVRQSSFFLSSGSPDPGSPSGLGLQRLHSPSRLGRSPLGASAELSLAQAWGAAGLGASGRWDWSEYQEDGAETERSAADLEVAAVVGGAGAVAAAEAAAATLVGGGMNPPARVQAVVGGQVHTLSLVCTPSATPPHQGGPAAKGHATRPASAVGSGSPSRGHSTTPRGVGAAAHRRPGSAAATSLEALPKHGASRQGGGHHQGGPGAHAGGPVGLWRSHGLLQEVLAGLDSVGLSDRQLVAQEEVQAHAATMTHLHRSAVCMHAAAAGSGAAGVERDGGVGASGSPPRVRAQPARPRTALGIAWAREHGQGSNGGEDAGEVGRAGGRGRRDRFGRRSDVGALWRQREDREDADEEVGEYQVVCVQPSTGEGSGGARCKGSARFADPDWCESPKVNNQGGRTAVERQARRRSGESARSSGGEVVDAVPRYLAGTAAGEAVCLDVADPMETDPLLAGLPNWIRTSIGLPPGTCQPPLRNQHQHYQHSHRRADYHYQPTDRPAGPLTRSSTRRPSCPAPSPVPDPFAPPTVPRLPSEPDLFPFPSPLDCPAHATLACAADAAAVANAALNGQLAKEALSASRPPSVTGANWDEGPPNAGQGSPRTCGTPLESDGGGVPRALSPGRSMSPSGRSMRQLNIRFAPFGGDAAAVVAEEEGEGAGEGGQAAEAGRKAGAQGVGGQSGRFINRDLNISAVYRKDAPSPRSALSRGGMSRASGTTAVARTSASGVPGGPDSGSSNAWREAGADAKLVHQPILSSGDQPGGVALLDCAVDAVAVVSDVPGAQDSLAHWEASVRSCRSSAGHGSLGGPLAADGSEDDEAVGPMGHSEDTAAYEGWLRVALAEKRKGSPAGVAVAVATAVTGGPAGRQSPGALPDPLAAPLVDGPAQTASPGAFQRPVSPSASPSAWHVQLPAASSSTVHPPPPPAYVVVAEAEAAAQEERPAVAADPLWPVDYVDHGGASCSQGGAGAPVRLNRAALLKLNATYGTDVTDETAAALGLGAHYPAVREVAAREVVRTLTEEAKGMRRRQSHGFEHSQQEHHRLDAHHQSAHAHQSLGSQHQQRQHHRQRPQQHYVGPLLPSEAVALGRQLHGCHAALKARSPHVVAPPSQQHGAPLRTYRPTSAAASSSGMLCSPTAGEPRSWRGRAASHPQEQQRHTLAPQHTRPASPGPSRPRSATNRAVVHGLLVAPPPTPPSILSSRAMLMDESQVGSCLLASPMLSGRGSKAAGMRQPASPAAPAAAAGWTPPPRMEGGEQLADTGARQCVG